MPQAATRTAFALHRLAERLQRQLATIEDLEVTPAESLVLTALKQRGPTAVGELLDLLGFRPSTLTTVVDRLTDRRLVVRQVRPDDRRSFLVLLTERGQEEARRAEAALALAQQRVLDDLEPALADALRGAFGDT